MACSPWRRWWTLNPPNRRGTDPYARWCGRGGIARCPPIPIDGGRARRQARSGREPSMPQPASVMAKATLVPPSRRRPRLRTPNRAPARVSTLSSDVVASAAAHQERHRAAPFAAAQIIRAMSATVRPRTILAPLLSPQRTDRGDACHAWPLPSAYRSDAPRHPATRCANPERNCSMVGAVGGAASPVTGRSAISTRCSC